MVEGRGTYRAIDSCLKCFLKEAITEEHREIISVDQQILSNDLLDDTF